MRKLITTLFLLFAALPCLAALAEPEVQYTLDGENHVVGTVSMDGYTFAIDALLDDTLPTANRVTYTIRNYDSSVIVQALRDYFPTTADALVEKLSSAYGGQIYAPSQLTSIMSSQILPYSQVIPDEKLMKLQGQCEAFLTQIGLSYHPIPYRCTYLIQMDEKRQWDKTTIPTENKDIATHIGISFLPTEDGAVAAPGYQIKRVGRTVKDNSDNLISETPAMFIFNLDGELETFTLHNLEMTTSGQLESGFLSWEDALCEMLEAMMENDHLREHITQNPTTFTSIRTAWDTDASGHGKPGWIISFYGTQPKDTSPLGWDDFGTTYFVYGE